MTNISSKEEVLPGAQVVSLFPGPLQKPEVERLSRPQPVGNELQRECEYRLVSLIEAAVTARSRARQYLRVGRKVIKAARRAREHSDPVGFAWHLREVRQLHGQARKSLHFARLCERRVQCLAPLGGYEDARQR